MDRAYQSLTARIIGSGRSPRGRPTSAASCGSPIRCGSSDQALGGQRPETVAALIAAVEARLDAARRLQLARDRWALRAPEFRQYRAAIQASARPVCQAGARARADQVAGRQLSVQPDADRERGLADSASRRARSAPPEEFRAAHALLVSAVQLAGSAGQIRREATLAEDIARAWDASSAAAGALMLGARARTDMQSLLRPPSAPVITPRRTRLVRVPDLHAFRHAIVGLSLAGDARTAGVARGARADRGRGRVSCGERIAAARRRPSRRGRSSTIAFTRGWTARPPV